jgi:hypothetical protein
LNCITHDIHLTFFDTSVTLVFVKAGLSEKGSVTFFTGDGMLLIIPASTIGLETRQALSGALMRVPFAVGLFAGVTVVVLAHESRHTSDDVKVVIVLV